MQDRKREIERMNKWQKERDGDFALYKNYLTFTLTQLSCDSGTVICSVHLPCTSHSHDKDLVERVR